MRLLPLLALLLLPLAASAKKPKKAGVLQADPASWSKILATLKKDGLYVKQENDNPYFELSDVEKGKNGSQRDHFLSLRVYSGGDGAMNVDFVEVSFTDNARGADGAIQSDAWTFKVSERGEVSSVKLYAITIDKSGAPVGESEPKPADSDPRAKGIFEAEVARWAAWTKPAEEKAK